MVDMKNAIRVIFIFLSTISLLGALGAVYGENWSAASWAICAMLNAISALLLNEQR
jgi:hypothetical protein